MNVAREKLDIIKVFGAYTTRINRNIRTNMHATAKKLFGRKSAKNIMEAHFPEEVIEEASKMASFAAVETFFAVLNSYEDMKNKESIEKDPY